MRYPRRLNKTLENFSTLYNDIKFCTQHDCELSNLVVLSTNYYLRNISDGWTFCNNPQRSQAIKNKSQTNLDIFYLSTLTHLCRYIIRMFQGSVPKIWYFYWIRGLWISFVFMGFKYLLFFLTSQHTCKFWKIGMSVLVKISTDHLSILEINKMI